MDIGTEKEKPIYVPLPAERPVPERRPSELPDPAPAEPVKVPA